VPDAPAAALEAAPPLPLVVSSVVVLDTLEELLGEGAELTAVPDTLEELLGEGTELTALVAGAGTVVEGAGILLAGSGRVREAGAHDNTVNAHTIVIVSRQNIRGRYHGPATQAFAPRG
jgi:hypothetical protein